MAEWHVDGENCAVSLETDRISTPGQSIDFADILNAELTENKGA